MTLITRRAVLIGGGAAAAVLASRQVVLAQARLTLRVTAAPSTVASMYQAMGTAFSARHPDIAVDIDTTQRDYDALVQATLRDGLTDRLADVSIQGNNKLRLYVDRGMAVPLDDYLAADAKSPDSTLSPSVASIGRFGGKVYGLGLSVSIPAVIRPNMFRRRIWWRRTSPPCAKRRSASSRPSPCRTASSSRG